MILRWSCGSDEEGELKEVAGRLELPPVDVDRVTEGLERIERDADRQEHVEEGRVCDLDVEKQLQNVGCRLRREVEVLEDAEEPQVGDQADHQPSLAGFVALGGVNSEADDVVDDRRPEDQDDVGGVPRHVEQAGRHEDEDDPQLGVASQHPEPRDSDAQEQNVVEAVEEHWSPYPALTRPVLAAGGPAR
jgi:hypothetical protein